jgi:hypothetical protein
VSDHPAATDGEAMRTNVETSRHLWLATMTGLIAFSALGGAVALATGVMGDEIIERLPFGSAVLGGLALAVVVALPMTVAAYQAAKGRPDAAATAMAAGLLLVGWILVQLAIIRTFSWLQPTMAIAGLLVFLGGCLTRPRPAHRRPDHLV